jgi:transcriptional regulator with XRE-family HTH domain
VVNMADSSSAQAGLTPDDTGPAVDATLPAHDPVMIGLDQLGARLAEGRRTKSLSQRELARRVGVSASLISQIESGKVQPSVATLMAIVNELGLSIDEMLHVADPGSPAHELPSPPTEAASPSPRLAPPANHSSEPRRGVVQNGADRALIELSSGVTWERLTVDSDTAVDFILVTYPPGAASSEGDQLLTHPGKEYWYIISGELHVRLVFDEYCARANDSFSFLCTLPHQFRNLGTVPVRAVVTIVHGVTDTR